MASSRIDKFIKYYSYKRLESVKANAGEAIRYSFIKSRRKTLLYGELYVPLWRLNKRSCYRANQVKARRGFPSLF